ncbi:MAG: glycosyltransferase family 4 protein [Planctomycetes bacterium]|nr:glycosyltransferase family 4 protein [Planctomycetota bacterium]
MIRVLHLFSNHKVTGPAELALDTARAVERYSREEAPASQEGGAGSREPVECRFLAGRHPADPPWLGDLARERGARLAELPGLELRKHFNPWRWLRDSRALADYLDRETIDALHCHMPNDHLTAALAVKRLKKRIPIVRTIYSGDPVPNTWRGRWCLRKHCDRTVCFSRAVIESLCQGPLRLPPEKLARLDPPIDTERFDPARRPALPDFRARHGIAPGAFVAGIVARMQTHRRFEVFLEAMRRVSEQLSDFRFVIIGRGTHQEEVARQPVRRLGLEPKALFAGYLTGDDYVAALFAFDLKVFLVPGSDGTCRAVREALSAGVPVLAARRGMLPELVQAGLTGEVVDDTPSNLAGAIVALAAGRDRLKGMAAAARRWAVDHFSYRRYAQALHEIYRSALHR